jgi:hypothetical protein
MRKATKLSLRIAAAQTKEAIQSRLGNNPLPNILLNWCPHFYPSFRLSSCGVPILKVEINSSHRSLIEKDKKMQPCSKIYYSNVS